MCQCSLCRRQPMRAQHSKDTAIRFKLQSLARCASGWAQDPEISLSFFADISLILGNFCFMWLIHKTLKKNHLPLWGKSLFRKSHTVAAFSGQRPRDPVVENSKECPMRGAGGPHGKHCLSGACAWPHVTHVCPMRYKFMVHIRVPSYSFTSRHTFLPRHH